jgi:type VII secretion protein EccE
VRAEAAALLAAVALLLAGVRSAPTVLVGAAAAAVLATVRLGDRPLAGWAGLAIGYATRPRSRVVPAERPGGHRRRPRPHPMAPTDALTAVLPGAVLLDARDRDGHEFGLIAWRDLLTVVVVVDAPDDPIVDLSRPVRVPLAEFSAVLARPELGLQSVQVLSEAWPIRPLPGVSHLAATVAWRRTHVAVQAGVEANAGIMSRGGGTLGATRLMATAAKRVQLALAEAGAPSHALTASEVRAAIASSAGLNRDPDVLREQWSDVTSSASRHRTFAAENSAAAAIDALIAPAAERVTTSVVLTGAAPTCTIRLSAARPPEIDAATEQLAAAAARAGWRLRSLPGAQLAGLRATLPIGAVEC